MRDAPVRARLRVLAGEGPRWVSPLRGVPRLHWLLLREGLVRNHKRTERLYQEERLALRRRRRRTRAAPPRVPPDVPAAPGERWSMDFVHDTLADGRVFRCLTVVDDFTRECPLIAVDASPSGARVADALDRLAGRRGLPAWIVCDNGPEFTRRAILAWVQRRGVRVQFIRAGTSRRKPVENAFVESFNGRFRDECLNEHWFLSVADARELIEHRPRDYNAARPHSALAGRTPAEFLLVCGHLTPHPTHNRRPGARGKGQVRSREARMQSARGPQLLAHATVQRITVQVLPLDLGHPGHQRLELGLRHVRQDGTQASIDVASYGFERIRWHERSGLRPASVRTETDRPDGRPTEGMPWPEPSARMPAPSR